MSRTKGAKDKAPRKLNEASIANLANPIPGFQSASVRIYAPASDVRWFEGQTPKERGAVVTTARRRSE